MRIFELVIEPGRDDHIARHRVTVEEVEEVVAGNALVRRVAQGYLRLIGQTDAGRYLAVFVAPRGSGVYGLVTAREATPAERRLYQQHRGKT